MGSLLQEDKADRSSGAIVSTSIEDCLVRETGNIRADSAFEAYEDGDSMQFRYSWKQELDTFGQIRGLRRHDVVLKICYKIEIPIPDSVKDRVELCNEDWGKRCDMKIDNRGISLSYTSRKDEIRTLKVSGWTRRDLLDAPTTVRISYQAHIFRPKSLPCIVKSKDAWFAVSYGGHVKSVWKSSFDMRFLQTLQPCVCVVSDAVEDDNFDLCDGLVSTIKHYIGTREFTNVEFMDFDKFIRGLNTIPTLRREDRDFRDFRDSYRTTQKCLIQLSKEKPEHDVSVENGFRVSGKFHLHDSNRGTRCRLSMNLDVSHSEDSTEAVEIPTDPITGEFDFDLFGYGCMTCQKFSLSIEVPENGDNPDAPVWVEIDIDRVHIPRKKRRRFAHIHGWARGTSDYEVYNGCRYMYASKNKTVIDYDAQFELLWRDRDDPPARPLPSLYCSDYSEYEEN